MRCTVGRILNHVEPGVAKIYDRYSYDKETKETLEAWSKPLLLMVSDLREVGTLGSQENGLDAGAFRDDRQ